MKRFILAIVLTLLISVGASAQYSVSATGAISANIVAPLASPTFTGIVTVPTVNVSGLTASLPVCTDGSKNLTTTCPAGDQPILIGTTGSIGGGALLAGGCATANVTVNGVASNMVFYASPATAAASLTVKASSINAYYVSANTVEVDVCMAVAGTPTASNYNVRVIQ